jgi:16S rRNA (cytosine1402-N4)-methyltransferase
MDDAHTANEELDANDAYHIPVLLQETVGLLQIRPDGIYVDCTLGGGGHSRAMLAQLGEKGRLFVFDQDAAAQANVPDDARIVFVPQNFRHIRRFLRLHEVTQVDGILADLGVSSHQLDAAERGFSHRFEAGLDMRMDRRQALTAEAIIGSCSAAELKGMLERYGEVTNAKTLAARIVERRAQAPIRTISDFKTAVADCVKGNPARYFSQVFQAFRIAVNDELGALEELLPQAEVLLRPGGRLAIITFHSLEDRMVKNFFRKTPGDADVFDLYGADRPAPWNIITKKPVLPGEEEIRMNPRSRSAKLRVAEKK